ncbi:hypothetical protein KY092_17900 [Natronomonas gomsonensis]|uniref:hypothetical protein n=1 Tax=Natronomonas gomsonensis TaxID=1046043 RepID=UPI0020CA9057|nr:hypothetical protein [Natronomonas gomsonensis]MCY4732426.1 hypothetical protein [Natronomonas gomsonensis]
MSPLDLPRTVRRDLLGNRTEPRSDKEHIEATVRWLFRSQDVTDSNGSAANYSLLTGWSGPYPETTGYIIPTLYDYAAYAESSEARQRAEKMARWLLELQLDEGAFPEGVDPGPEANPSVFNTGQILLGLIRAYRETSDVAFRRAASSAADWLTSVQHKNGYWDKYDYRGERHVYCSRVAWALIEASQIISKERYRSAAKAHLDWVLSQQAENGWFKHAGFSPREIPYLHTIAYTIRGLLESGLLLGIDRYIDAAERTSDILNEAWKSDGSLKATYDEAWESSSYRCLTGEAQMVIVWSRLSSIEQHQRYMRSIKTTIEDLKKFQIIDSSSPDLNGGIKGSHPVWQRYMWFRYPNWAAKFFVDALLYQ